MLSIPALSPTALMEKYPKIKNRIPAVNDAFLNTPDGSEFLSISTTFVPMKEATVPTIIKIIGKA